MTRARCARATTAVTTTAVTVLLTCTSITLGACAPRVAAEQNPANASAPAAGLDSLRGIVRVTGNAPGALVLESAPGGASDVTGDGLDALRAADGLEVTLFGRVGAPSGVTPSQRGFVVARFAVRGAAGLPAVDGVLERGSDGSLAIRLADGTRHRLASVPEPLRTAIGARIYWAGAFDTPPSAYGILTAAPDARSPAATEVAAGLDVVW